MRNTLKYSFTLLIGMLLLGACEEVVYFDDVEFESRITVNSLFDSNSPWSVNVSRSHNILDANTDITPVGNAKVLISSEGREPFELIHVGDGNYEKEGAFPSTARGYTVEVTVGDEMVSAYGYVPEESKLFINDFHVEKVDETNVIKGVEVDFRIEDKSSFESYFIWEIVSIVSDDASSTEPLENSLASNFLDNLKGDADDTDFRKEIVGGGLFGDGTYSTTFSSLASNRSPGLNLENDDSSKYGNDVLALGKNEPNSSISSTISDKIVFTLTGGDDDGNGGIDPSGGSADLLYELRVMSISKELYDFYHSVEEYDGDNDSVNPSDLIYSNIEGGIGIFAGFNENSKRF